VLPDLLVLLPGFHEKAVIFFFVKLERLGILD